MVGQLTVWLVGDDARYSYSAGLNGNNVSLNGELVSLENATMQYQAVVGELGVGSWRTSQPSNKGEPTQISLFARKPDESKDSHPLWRKLEGATDVEFGDSKPPICT